MVKDKFVAFLMIWLMIIIILMNGLLDLERKIVVIFLSHSYFKISKTLRLNIHYLILFKIIKNQLSQIYIDQSINQYWKRIILQAYFRIK